jgi:spermidine synthase
MTFDSDRRLALALSLAVFLSGAVLLGVEIAASRLLAPTFGSSLYVWGALIGVVLAGLAVGYGAGGVLADRWPSPWLLVAALTLGAGLVLLIPVLDDEVLSWVVAWDPGPRLDPLLASVLLFGPASIVLASASPIAVRLAARSLDRLGRTAGRLFSISTVGSIVGTFATAFWLVPTYGTDQVIAVGAVVLLAAAAIVALAEGMLAPAITLAAAAAASVAVVVSLAPETGGTLEGSALRNWSPVVRAREVQARGPLDPAAVDNLASGHTVREALDTRYHRLLVTEDGDSRYLRFDSSFQSGMWLNDPYKTRFAYTDYLHLGLAYNPAATRVLVIGLGGAAVQKRLWRDFRDVQVTTVELDPDVVAAARRWFALPDDPRVRVEVGDGRRFLERSADRWDVIMVDAFYADGVPFQLTTLEFVQLLQERLSPGGVVATNVIGSLGGSSSKIVRALVKTYGAVFPTVKLHPVFDGAQDRRTDDIRNIVLVGTERVAPAPGRLVDAWGRVRETRAPRAPDLTDAIWDRWDRPLSLAGVPLLTDDYAPTDALLLE